MKMINRFKALSFFLIAAYLLSACGGTLQQSTTIQKGPKKEANLVAFSGVVEAMNGSQWTVGGQSLRLDPRVSLDPNIAVGDTVKIEGSVSADGAVVAMKIESSAKEDAISTASADANTPKPMETPDASGTSEPASSQAASGTQNEVFGTVEALTSDTITIDGVTYNLAQGFTEIKDTLKVGDQVKVHVILNADGTLTVREIEKTTGTTMDDNSSNSSGTDNGANHDINDDNSSSSNGLDNGANHDINDDNSANPGSGTDDGANHDGNDDHGGNGGNSGPGSG